MTELSRRNYLKKTALAVGSLLAVSKNLKAKTCSLTPKQTEGPFYPVKDQNDKDHDLTHIRGANKEALGEIAILTGIVTDENCKPIESALVEIWQACASGKYNHPGDPNPAPLDPNFQYWGRAVTNSKGEYHFKTIRPGHYQATNDWIRPSHIHLKVHRRGHEELTGQIYFKGDPYNAGDRILQSLSKDDRDKVIIDFKKEKTGNLAGQFNIVLKNL